MPTTLHRIVVDVVDEDLEAEGDCDWSEHQQSGVIDIHSSLLAGFTLSQEKCNWVSIYHHLAPRIFFYCC